MAYYGLHSHCPHSYGLYSYGLYPSSQALQHGPGPPQHGRALDNQASELYVLDHAGRVRRAML